MKKYEINKIRAELIAEICEYIEAYLDYVKNGNSDAMKLYESSSVDYEKALFQKALIRSDILSKIKITVDGIEL